MKYSELNTMLMEHFGDLEKLCNQIYGEHHGVTLYIDEMDSLYSKGVELVTDWKYYLKSLKRVRHKRNKLSHGEVLFQESFVDEEDIDFLVDFRASIMSRTDPLSLYREYTKSKKRIPDVKEINLISETTSMENDMNKRDETTSHGCANAILLILALLTAGFAVYYFFIAA
ncbi:MAG: hypothetical protein IJ447_04265 [Clostridia bacterium]|nr:hypothetical protein [Clostridia bacterium]